MLLRSLLEEANVPRPALYAGILRVGMCPGCAPSSMTTTTTATATTGDAGSGSGDAGGRVRLADINGNAVDAATASQLVDAVRSFVDELVPKPTEAEVRTTRIVLCVLRCAIVVGCCVENSNDSIG